MQPRYNGSGGEVATKQFNDCNVVGNHFLYHHQVYNNKNCGYYQISVERNWSTKYWPGRFHVYLLMLIDVNANYLRGHLVDGADVKPKLDSGVSWDERWLRTPYQMRKRLEVLREDG